MKKALVTGSSGFIGAALIPVLEQHGWQVERASRALYHDADSDPSGLAQADAVFHLAGLAHAGAQGADRDGLMAVNERQTLAFYQRCCAAGVGQFIWLSSIKVLGDSSASDLTIHAPYAPGDDYAASKVAGEQALLAADSGTTTLRIVRPPLVYGPGVKANFLALVKLAQSPWPLPLASAQAPRAWLGLDNLCDFLVALATREPPVDIKLWHVRDAEQSSVAQMVGSLRALRNRAPGLWPLPSAWAMAIGRALSRRAQVERLFLPLCVDLQDTIDQLGWQPPHSQQDQLAKVLAWLR